MIFLYIYIYIWSPPHPWPTFRLAPQSNILGLPTSSACDHVLFNSYSKLMHNPFLRAFLSMWSFLIQFLCKINGTSFLGCLPPPVVISYSILIQNWCKLFSWLPSSDHFLCNSYSKLMQNHLLATFRLLWSFRIFKIDAKSPLGYLPPPVVISCSILMQNWCKILSWLPSSACGHFLSNSYSKLLQILSWRLGWLAVWKSMYFLGKIKLFHCNDWKTFVKTYKTYKN